MPEQEIGSCCSFAVVIPAFNEGTSIRECAEAVLDQLNHLDPPAVLIVVDDGSVDDTPKQLEAVDPPRGVRYEWLRHRQNAGYGAALRTGAARAAQLSCEWVLFMDSDLTNPPEHIARFVARMGPGVDYLKASRYGPDAGVVGVPWPRRLASGLGNRFARLVSGTRHRDTTNGFRAIRTGEFLALPLQETGFAVIMEELYWVQSRRLRGADVPTTLLARQSTQRTSLFGYRPSVLVRYAKYPLRAGLDRLRRPRRPPLVTT